MYSLLISLIFCSTILNSQAQADRYSMDNLDQAKRAAAVKNKLLLLRFTAKWCLPCKYMEKNVFQDYQFNEFLQERVVEVVVDVDNFKGMNIKEDYRVRSLPTILILNPNAKEVGRKESSMGLVEMKNWIEGLLVQNNTSITSLNKVVVGSSTNTVENSKLSNTAQSINSPSEESHSKTTSEQNFNTLFGSFYVQLGAYEDFENAMFKANELDEMFSQNASIHESDVTAGNKIYKINLGPFDSEEEADLFVLVLKDRHIDAFTKKAEF